MGLAFVIGYNKDIITAKERAVYYYNQIEGQKIFHAVETHVGKNELEEPAWFTTIWFTHIEPKPEEVKHTFIGSEGIDPRDPNWQEKLQALTDNYNAPVSLQEGSGATEDEK